MRTQLPVEIKQLLDEVTDIKAAKETSLSVSVYVDDAAPAELVAHVRNAFASSVPTVRMTVSYLEARFAPHPTDDVAVIVAGESALAGEGAAAVRAVGVPAMVVTLSPDAVHELATKAGNEIPEGDIVSPSVKQSEDNGDDGNSDDAKADKSNGQAVVFDEEMAASLDERMGRWIVSVCREKRMAFAIAFPFMRRPLAKDAVQTTALQNAIVGLIPILPGADLPVMTLNQVKMALQIAAAYGQDMDTNRAKELAFVVGGAFVSRSLARKLVGMVPVLGFFFKTGIAYGTTTAVGYAIIEYFEGGQDVTGVANVLERAAETGTKAAAFLQDKSDLIQDKTALLQDKTALLPK